MPLRNPPFFFFSPLCPDNPAAEEGTNGFDLFSFFRSADGVSIGRLLGPSFFPSVPKVEMEIHQGRPSFFFFSCPTDLARLNDPATDPPPPSSVVLDRSTTASLWLFLSRSLTVEQFDEIIPAPLTLLSPFSSPL